MNENPPAELTCLLQRWGGGDEVAFDRVIHSAYDDLARIGRGLMRRERPGNTLQTHDLLHEAYLRLRGLDRIRWRDRGHFFTAAAGAMRRVLVDRARARQAQKRGGDAICVSLDDVGMEPAAGTTGVDVLALDDALTRLAEVDSCQARVVELRYFGGLTLEQTAAALEISPASVKRKWAVARAWLYRELT